VPGANTPVIRLSRGPSLSLVSNGGSDDEPAWSQPASQIEGQIVRPEVDACGTGSEGSVETVIDQHRNIQRSHQCSGEVCQLACRRVLESELKGGGAPALGRVRELDQIATSNQGIVGYQHQADERRYIMLHDPLSSPAWHSGSHDSRPQRSG
jgi:hypothetical protein